MCIYMYIYNTRIIGVHTFTQGYVRGSTAQTHGEHALQKHVRWVGIAPKWEWKTLLQLRRWKPRFRKDVARTLSSGLPEWTYKCSWSKLLLEDLEKGHLFFNSLHVLPYLGTRVLCSQIFVQVVKAMKGRWQMLMWQFFHWPWFFSSKLPLKYGGPCCVIEHASPVSYVQLYHLNLQGACTVMGSVAF